MVGDSDEIFCFKQKTAYEMRISDWSSDVCSSDLLLMICVGYEEFGQAIRAASIEAVHRGNRLDPTAHTPSGHENDQVYRFGDQPLRHIDRKSVVLGKSVSVRVDLGGRSIIKKKHQRIIYTLCSTPTPRLKT